MIRPLRDMVLVELRDAPAAPGALIVVRAERQPTTRATVLAVGEEVRDAVVGARVIISRLQGIEIAGGALLLPESAVLATESVDVDPYLTDKARRAMAACNGRTDTLDDD